MSYFRRLTPLALLSLLFILAALSPITVNSPAVPLALHPNNLKQNNFVVPHLPPGVEINANIPAQTVMADTTITYTVDITNTGDITDTFNISVASSLGWPVMVDQTAVTLPAGAFTNLEVVVMVPITATDGAVDTTTTTAVSQADSGVTDSIALITTVANPIITIAITELNATLFTTSTTTSTLTITNTGTAVLDWSISEHTGALNIPTSASEVNIASSYVNTANKFIAETAEDDISASTVTPPTSLSSYVVPTAVLYNNGPLVTNPGAGSGGTDVSMLQTVSFGMGTIGFGHQISVNNRVVDDFVVPAGRVWTIDQATFFAYQTGSTTTSTITGYNYFIYDAPPNAGGTVIFSGSTILNSVWSNIYRVTETTISNTSRPIMATTVDFDGFSLPAGTYWLEWQANGSLGSGPWAPPISILGQPVTGNALQGLNGVYGPAQDGGTGTPQQGFPFILEGTDAPACDTNIPWLSENPTSGSVTSSSSSNIEVTFDSTGYAPGVYTGTLCLNSNDPVTPFLTLPVTMTVMERVYNLELTATPTAITDTAGSTATYTLWVTNTGNTNDTFDITLSSHSWSTSISAGSLSLDAGETDSITIQVTIPATSTGGLTDVVQVTVTSQGDNSIAEQVSLTTIAAINYGLELTANPTEIAGLVGTTVTYTLWITNTGNVSDTFDVDLADYSWPTTGSDSSLTLNAGETTSLSVWVTIPATATNGLTDTTVVTVTSQGDNGVTDEVNLTTTAVVNAINGIEIMAEAVEMNGSVGTTITYTIWVTNTGNVNDTYTVELSGHSWATSASDTSVSLAPGATSSFMVMVSIPLTAINGQIDTVMVTVTSQGNSVVSGTVPLTTRAMVQNIHLYLPIINREP